MLLFPVTVTIPGDPDVVHTPAKVYAAQGTTTVYVWDRSSRSAVVAATLDGEPVKAGLRQWRVGDALVAETGGCGCGHPLKRWVPPKPVVA